MLVLFAASGAFTQCFAQEAMALQVLVGADLIASETEVCVPGDPVADLVTFQIDESTLTNPAPGIEEVQWAILRNGSPALPGDYELDATIGPDLVDWNEETTLSFAPLTDGIFEVSGEVIWASLSQNLEPAFLEVGAAPDAPIYNIPETAFCDLDGELDVASSVLTPNGLATDLCATIVNLATGLPLSLPGVDCETSGANPTAVTNNFLVTTLNAGCYMLELEATNRCGATSVEVDIDVLGTPNFSLSLTPFCESDPDAVIVSDFDLTFTNCDNDAPLLTETWTLEGDEIEVTTANEFPLPDSLGYVNGDVVCQTIDLAYPIVAGDTLHCTAQSCEDILFFEAAAIEWQVTYPVTWPPVCAGDTIEIEIIDPPLRSTHEWDTDPLPDSTSSNTSSLANCVGNLSSENVANYFALDTDGVTGIIRRTTCHVGPGGATATCLTDTTFEIDVAPKPSIAWLDSINDVTACAYETSTSLSIVIDNDNNATPSDWTLTWTVTTANGTVSDIVQTIPSAQILANATVSLSVANVIAACFGGNANQVTSFNVQVSAVNDSGCESPVLDGSMTLYAAPLPSAIFEAICDGDCVEPLQVNADGGLEFQWFLDSNSCDGVDEIPSDIAGGVCPTPFPWDLGGSGFEAVSTDSDPLFCDVNCTSTIGMRLQQSWTLATVEDSLLQCTSPLVRHELEVVPYPELQITSEGALCDNLDEFTFSAFNCNDLALTQAPEPCLDCPATTCESCFSEITTISDWKYSINGGSTYGPPFFAPLSGDVVSISAATLTSGLNPILLRVTAQTSSPNYPSLLCESIEVISFDWYEAPTIPVDGLILPEYLCPGSDYELDAVALTENGSQDELCFLWEDCVEEDSPVVWEISGQPCVNDECGVAQGQGVLESSASISVPLDIDPCTDVCIDLTITDSAGCQVDSNIVLDVLGLPSLEGLTVMEAFGTATSITALDPPCADPAENNTTPTECPGTEVLVGDTTNAFCAGSKYLLKAEGVEPGCADNSPGGGTSEQRVELPLGSL